MNEIKKWYGWWCRSGCVCPTRPNTALPRPCAGRAATAEIRASLHLRARTPPIRHQDDPLPPSSTSAARTLRRLPDLVPRAATVQPPCGASPSTSLLRRLGRAPPSLPRRGSSSFLKCHHCTLPAGDHPHWRCHHPSSSSLQIVHHAGPCRGLPNRCRARVFGRRGRQAMAAARC